MKAVGEGDKKGWMVGCHHWLDAHEFEQALGVGDGQGSLMCCILWDHKELDMNEWPKWLIYWSDLTQKEPESLNITKFLTSS